MNKSKCVEINILKTVERRWEVKYILQTNVKNTQYRIGYETNKWKKYVSSFPFVVSDGSVCQRRFCCIFLSYCLCHFRCNSVVLLSLFEFEFRVAVFALTSFCFRRAFYVFRAYVILTYLYFIVIRMSYSTYFRKW